VKRPGSFLARRDATEDDPNVVVATAKTTENLLQKIASIPKNSATNRVTTKEILALINELEATKACPTPDEKVVEKLSGK
jgi:hypothetical protein